MTLGVTNNYASQMCIVGEPSNQPDQVLRKGDRSSGQKHVASPLE